MPKSFRPYSMDQQLLLPPDLRDWLPEGHLALFVSDVVEQLDLSAILDTYEQGDGRGRPPYHPAMMVKLLVYGYCTGVTSSRRIERATYEDVPFRVLAGNQHPDHDSVADFRKRHLPALAGLFTQVLKLCEKAGLVKLGRVAVDGTKVKANASKHKAMSYERMEETERRLEEEVKRLLEEAERVDAEEDAQFGKGKRGDELPEELARRESRLKKIREAKEKAEKEAAEQRARLEERERKERESGRKMGGRPPRIMLDGATKGFVQGYNAQIAVAAEAQVIVATIVTQAANDNGQLVPTLMAVSDNLGRLPDSALADAGYFSEANATDPALASVDRYTPPNRREKRAASESKGTGTPAGPAAKNMSEKLATPEGKALYKLRKAIVEPVFGQIKEVRGFRRFSFRKLFRRRPQLALAR